MTAKEAKTSWLADPEVFAVNRVEAHSDHLYYEKEEEISLAGDMPLRQSLNGTLFLMMRRKTSICAPTERSCGPDGCTAAPAGCSGNIGRTGRIVPAVLCGRSA